MPLRLSWLARELATLAALAGCVWLLAMWI